MNLWSRESALLVLIGSALLVPAPVRAQEPGDAKESAKPAIAKPDSAAMEAMMKLYEKYATPGPRHKLLEKGVGKWQLSMRCWMDPAAPPMASKGMTEGKLMFGGRYLFDHVKGEMMGKPFDGLSILGYDNFKEKYTMVWLDSMGTAIFTSLGTPDESGQVITFWGEMDEPATGERNKKIRSVFRMESDDRHLLEMYDKLPDGKEIKVMEITYTRRK
jgi:hypothetical protein